MAACAETLTPVLIECGGKDAMIVDDDADLDAAADAAAWGGLSNAGQTCIGIERVYVVDTVYDDFLARLVAKLAVLRAGSDDRASYGPITMPVPDRRHPPAHRRRPGPRRPRGGGRVHVRGRRPTSTRSCWSTYPPTPRHDRRDLRPDAGGGAGARRGRGCRPGQRLVVRARFRRLREAARDGAGPPGALRDDLGQLRDRLRHRARAAVRRRRATPGSAGSTAPTACASSAAPRRSPGSGSRSPSRSRRSTASRSP